MTINSIIRTILIFALVTVVMAAAVFLFLRQDQGAYVQQLSELQVEYERLVASMDTSEDIGGAIYISGISIGEGEGSLVDENGIARPLSNYFYMLQAQDIVETPLNPIRYLNKKGANSEFLFISQPSQNTEFVEPALFYANNDLASPMRRLEAQASSIINRHLPRWSNNGNYYLYSGQEENIGDVDDIGSWKIYVGDIASGEPRYFADGYGAVWVLDDQYIMYMTEEGLVSKRFEPGTSDYSRITENVLIQDPSGLRFSRANQLGVGLDGEYLAVSFPSARESGESRVGIYRIAEVDGLVQIHLASFVVLRNELPFWPLFSPGGRYLSLQIKRLDTESIALLGETAIVIYDLLEREFIQQVGLDTFHFDYLFNTDWAL